MRTVSGRACSRAGCRSQATMTLTYVYSESTAVVGPLATFSEPHAYDLCEKHGERLTVPNGWNVIINFRAENYPMPKGELLLSTRPLNNGKIPAGTTVWFKA